MLSRAGCTRWVGWGKGGGKETGDNNVEQGGMAGRKAVACTRGHVAPRTGGVRPACRELSCCALPPPQSLLSAVRASFGELKHRLGSTAVGGALFLDRPVFGVDLQLRVPSVVLHPSLEEIQEAINSTAKKASGGGSGGGRSRGFWSAPSARSCTRFGPVCLLERAARVGRLGLGMLAGETMLGLQLKRAMSAARHASLALLELLRSAPSLQVLQVTKQLRRWSAEDGEATYYDLIAQVQLVRSNSPGRCRKRWTLWHAARCAGQPCWTAGVAPCMLSPPTAPFPPCCRWRRTLTSSRWCCC